MKKISLLMITLFVLALNSKAEVLLIDDFDYKADSALLIQNGWDDQWGNHNSPLTISNGLLMENHPNNGGSSLLLDIKSSLPLHKKLSKQVTEGNCYYSFLFQYSFISKEGWFIGLRDNKLTNQDFNMNARVVIDYSGNLALSFKEKGNAVYSNKYLGADTTYLIVVKYTVNAGEYNDEVSIYAFDDYASAQTEPAKALVGPIKSNNAEELDINPAYMILRGFDKYSTLNIDAIRVGTTWGDVVPPMESTAIELNELKQNIYSIDNGIQLQLSEDNNTVNIFDCVGKNVYSNANVPANYHVNLNKGIYIVNVNGKSCKVLVK